jgi:hypothetical protein
VALTRIYKISTSPTCPPWVENWVENRAASNLWKLVLRSPVL